MKFLFLILVTGLFLNTSCVSNENKIDTNSKDFSRTLSSSNEDNLSPETVAAMANYPSTLSRYEKWWKSDENLEKKIAAQVLQSFRVRQHMNRLQRNKGVIKRGTHAKGVCASGSMQVLSKQQIFAIIPEASKKRYIARYHSSIGKSLRSTQLFSKPGDTYAVNARLSNANGLGLVQKDTKSDIRGFSMSIDLGSGKQDFSMNSSMEFQIPDVETFYLITAFANHIKVWDQPEVADSQGKAPGLGFLLKNLFKSKTKHFKGFGIEDKALAIAKTLKTLKAGSEAENYPKSFSSQSFNTGTVFALNNGNNFKNIVRVGTFPCTEANGRPKEIHSSNIVNQSVDYDSIREYEQKETGDYLIDKFKTNLATGNNYCQYMYVQFLYQTEEMGIVAGTNSEKITTYVENPSKTWSGPLHPVAKIELKKIKECGDHFINLTQNRAGNIVPLGQINRMRVPAEKASYLFRKTKK